MIDFVGSCTVSCQRASPWRMHPRGPDFRVSTRSSHRPPDDAPVLKQTSAVGGQAT